MNKITLFLAFMWIFSHTVTAQSAEESVKSTIQLLFDGMRAADSASVKKTFASEARLLTVVEQEGETRLREAPLSSFLEAVGSPRDEVWDERILDYQIRVDDRMATAWTPYEFYRDDTFSHCGVNAFQFYLSSEGWKIIQITDTRRKEGCPK